MLDKYDLEKVKDQRFYSERVKGFVEIKGLSFIFNGKTINLKDVSIIDEEIQEILSDLLNETKTKCRLEKRISHAFGKDVYLLGRNTEGELMWLEAPKWDCSWYWGFGYVETYIRNAEPSRARDIQSHSHFSGLVGHQLKWDNGTGVQTTGEYVHNVYDSPQLVETTFTSDEGWELSELFKEFYLLEDMAEYTHKQPAGCHLTTSPVTQDEEKMKEWHEYINKTMIPKITAEIMRMLKP